MLGALALSIVAVYCILAVLYRSYALPLVVMLTVPLASVGALGSLFIFRAPLNLYSMLGIVMLVGLVGRTGFCWWEYAERAVRGAAGRFRRRSLRRSALWSDRDDDARDDCGNAAAGDRSHGRRRVSPSAGNRRDRRSLDVAAADAGSGAGYVCMVTYFVSTTTRFALRDQASCSSHASEEERRAGNDVGGRASGPAFRRERKSRPVCRWL